jgi:hypothetical protein
MRSRGNFGAADIRSGDHQAPQARRLRSALPAEPSGAIDLRRIDAARPGMLVAATIRRAQRDPAPERLIEPIRKLE